MRLGNIYCKVMCLLMLTMLTTLWSEIGEPVRINDSYRTVFSAGKQGMQLSEEELHLTYRILGPATYNRWSINYTWSIPPYQSFYYLEVDDDIIYYWIFGEPVLGAMSDGSLQIFYTKVNEDDHNSYLMKADLSSEGEILWIDSLSSDVFRTPQVVNRNDTLHLLYSTGNPRQPFHHQLFFDKYIAIDDQAGNIRFYGSDVIFGPVHSNTDIWIRQMGGGDNEGWPTFYGPVTTSGTIRVLYEGEYPEELVFRGGLIENHPIMELSAIAESIREYGIRPLGSIEYNDRIYFVTIEGNTYSSMIGQILPGEPQVITLYDFYPPYGIGGVPIDTYTISIPDTVWTTGPSGIVDNMSVFVPGELWISGNIAGRQTWGSSSNIYIKGDLTYQNTVPGLPPDGGLEGQHPINTTDMLALVSEKSIYIQYGFRDPTDGLRYKPNCDDIYIYGFLYALGDGGGDTTSTGIHHKDGIFTFQYQFPKGSTPDQMFMGEFYTLIDLHLRRYPTSEQHPWPPGLDYPWYNPLWPEPGSIFNPGTPYTAIIPNPHNVPTITFLRGTINLYGGIASRRAGFARRSGNQDFDTGIWDLDNYLFGRYTNNPTGYSKYYQYDTRVEEMAAPDIPEIVMPDGPYSALFKYWRQDADDQGFSELWSTEMVTHKDNMLLDVYEDRVAILLGNTLYLSDEAGGNFQTVELQIDNEGVLNMIYAPEGIYFLTLNRVQLLDMITQTFTIIDERNLPNSEQGIAIDGGYVIWAASIDLETVQFNIYTPDGELVEQYNWEHGIERFPGYESEDYMGNIGLIVKENQIFISLYSAVPEIGILGVRGDLYVANGYLDYLSTENPNLPEMISLNHYPNPYYRGRNTRNEGITISFNLPEESPIKLDIFNIKGQLVSTILQDTLTQGKHIVNWDGRDERMRSVAQGIYFYKLDTGKTSMVRKILVLN